MRGLAAETTKPDRDMAWVLLGHEYRAHAARSGYARLADAMPEGEAVLVDQQPPADIVRRGLTWAARKMSASRYCSWAGLSVQTAAVRRMLAPSQPTLFHLLYGHAGYAWAARWARRTGHSCVATFHMPPSVAHQVLRRPQTLAWLDGVVLVGSSQRSFFAPYVRDDAKLFVVPHGVDCDYFTPAETPRQDETITCLSVGTYLRNFEMLERVADQLRGQPNIRFVVVAPEDAAPRLADRPNVAFVHGLSDANLRSLYRHADLFVLTAHDATANNALLEAMACGLPVVTEDVGSLTDYCGTDNAVLCRPNAACAMAATIRELAAQPAARAAMAAASRRRAEALAWPLVAERMRDVYRTIASRRTSCRLAGNRLSVLSYRHATG